ncbi:hypothetical protein TPY_2434 [Sulfobacillus acidophilus TPY]|nr:hypothetical protein TPY_2434 [Sulfobacillus acidophilus TPY]
MVGYHRNPLGALRDYQRLSQFIESRYDVTNARSILRMTQKIFRQDHSYAHRFVLRFVRMSPERRTVLSNWD